MDFTGRRQPESGPKRRSAGKPAGAPGQCKGRAGRVDRSGPACYEPSREPEPGCHAGYHACRAQSPGRRSQDGGATVKERIREIDKEYGFNLGEDEIETIAKQAEETHRLLQELYKVDVNGVAPMVKSDRR